MTDEELAAVRRYTSAEVVQLLNIPPKWLKELVRHRRIPHQRTGETKGVWFTAADIVEIGRMLPQLMSHSRPSGETGAPHDPSGTELPAAPSDPVAGLLADWAQLKVHKRRPRRTGSSGREQGGPTAG